MENKKYYAGIGSRETPKDVLDLMRNGARELAKKGWVLRSGAADGADTAFESGADEATGEKEIFLPYKGFRGNPSELYADPTPEAEEIASSVHPCFDKMALHSFARKAHARNMHQIFGKDLNTPVEFVACWTPDGAENASESQDIDHTGGTRSAVVAAANKEIPVFNLARPDGLKRLVGFINEGKLLEKEPWEPDQQLLKSIKDAKIAKRNQKRKKP